MDDPVRSLLSLIPVFRDKHVALAPLDGGLTNRNYRLEVGGEVFVLRVGGADTHLLGIARDREVACARAAAAAGIAPEVVAYLPEQHALVRRFVPGRLLEPDNAKQPVTLRRVAETLSRCHGCPVSDEMEAFSPFATIRNYHALAREKSVPLPRDLDQALGILSKLECELVIDEASRLCHNDLLPNNFIDDGHAIQLIDWEYAGLGDRFFDLGNLAVNFQFDGEAESAFLKYYCGDIWAKDLRRLRMMRLVSDLRESLWGYLQAGISRLFTPEYYLEYGRKHLDRFFAASTQGQG